MSFENINCDNIDLLTINHQPYTGASGYVGATGQQGATGYTGATGSAGGIGRIGATGFQGPAGPTGATGPTGMQGSSGATGLVGTSPYVPPNNCYVSSIVGNDVSGNGTFELPYATINKCISVGSAPSTELVIICVDGSTFTEVVSLVGNIFITAPYATFTNNTSTTTVTNTAGHNWIYAATVTNTSTGNSIQNLTGATLHATVDFVYQGDVVNSASSGILFLTGFQVLTNLNNASSGKFFADLVTAPGGVIGTVNSNWSNSLTPGS